MPIYKPRNPYAFHPLMKKGGAHQKGKTALRQNIKQQVDHGIDEWFESEEEKCKERSKECSFFGL